MLPKKAFIVLVFALPVLLVTFSVLMGAYLLMDAAGDAMGAYVVRCIGVGVLLLFIVDFVLLVGGLGINAVITHAESSDRLE